MEEIRQMCDCEKSSERGISRRKYKIRIYIQEITCEGLD
jgi:hypothetical protein